MNWELEYLEGLVVLRKRAKNAQGSGDGWHIVLCAPNAATAYAWFDKEYSDRHSNPENYTNLHFYWIRPSIRDIYDLDALNGIGD